MAKNFNGFGGGNMQALMRQAQKLQEDMKNAQATLAETEFEGEAGGDLVKITMKGDKTLVGVSIKPEAIDPDDIEMLEDLLVAAFNDAAEKIADETARVMGPYAGMLGGLM